MIEAAPISTGWLLTVPLGPSTNARMMPVRMGGHCQNILTKVARDYIENVGAQLAAWRVNMGFKPREGYFYFDYWIILPRTNADPSNYDKVLLDTFQRGGIITNDRYALPRVMGVGYNSKRPEVTVRI